MNRDETPGKGPIPARGAPSHPLFPERPGKPSHAARATVIPEWRLVEKRAERFGADLRAVEDLLRRTAAGVKDPVEREALAAARFVETLPGIVAPSGRLALEWRIRPDPTRPPGPGNEQDPRGAAVVLRLATPPRG